MWVLDNITPIEEIDAAVEAEDFHLFTSPPAKQWQIWNRGGIRRRAMDRAQSAPRRHDRLLPERRDQADRGAEEAEARPRQDHDRRREGQSRRDRVRDRRSEGINRYVWQLRYDGPKKIAFGKEPPPSDFFDPNRGPDVVPGTYKVTVAGGRTDGTREVSVGPDPRWPVDAEVLNELARRPPSRGATRPPRSTRC